MKRITQQQRNVLDRQVGIVALYKSGKYTTEQIAKNYSISPRQVQRIATKYGIIRTQAEANKLIAPLKNYKTIPAEFKVKRKYITNKLRFEIINKHPYCTVCGMRPNDGVRLEVDHIDNNPTNNTRDNLQVLCTKCNTGKWHLDYFGE